MVEIKTFRREMQPEIEACFKACAEAIGWTYQPEDRHADMVHIEDAYMPRGCFWCLFAEGKLAGMVAVRNIDEGKTAAEMKRLYVLPEFQGKGYGGMLFRHALDYAKEQGYRYMRADTRRDRAASRHLMETCRFREIQRYNNNEFAELYFELNLATYEGGPDI